MAKLRIVVAGLVHDHVWHLLQQFQQTGQAELIAGADPHAPLRAKLRREFGVERTYADWRDLLATERADAAVLCASNAGSVPVAIACARKGLDVLVEKPMAATLAQARAMHAAARRAGTRLMVNWPIAWSPPVVRAMEMAEGGDLGRVFHASVFMSHQGPKEAGCTQYFYGWLYDARQNGGGAIIDYCCYGAATFAALWGRPRQVWGTARTFVKRRFPVDDNATIAAIYDERQALAQASWTRNPDFHESEFCGDKATVATRHGRLIFGFVRPRDYHHWGANRIHERVIPLAPRPRGLRSGPEHFLWALKTGKPFTKLCRSETGVQAQEILEAGIRSNRTGRRITL